MARYSERESHDSERESHDSERESHARRDAYPSDAGDGMRPGPAATAFNRNPGDFRYLDADNEGPSDRGYVNEGFSQGYGRGRSRHGYDRGYHRGGYAQGYGRPAGDAAYDEARPNSSPQTGGPHTGRGPKGYKRSPESIREDICERMTWNGDLDASDIEVRVDGDEVTLEGTVESRRMKRLAEDVTESVFGIHDVHNRLRVRRSDERSNEDASATETVLQQDGTRKERTTETNGSAA